MRDPTLDGPQTGALARAGAGLDKGAMGEPAQISIAAPPFARFAVAGCCGFATDAAVLVALVQGLGVNPHLARFGSFACALVVTWTINRLWTFPGRAPLRRRLPLYVLVQVVGAALNVGIYSGALLIAPALAQFLPLALVPAALAGLSVTYLGSKHIAFAHYGRSANP